MQKGKKDISCFIPSSHSVISVIPYISFPFLLRYCKERNDAAIHPMNVKIEPHESGLPDISMVKTSQILTISKIRLEKKLGQLSEEKIEEVNQAIKLSLGLENLNTARYDATKC